jgi:FAD/FMN-containing dehydrogenase
MDYMAEHATRSAALLAEFHAAKSSGAPIGLQKTTSNLFRHRQPAARKKLDVRSFDHVLRVDPQRMIAEVEGMTTYEALVDETLRFGLLPAIVPQLKTITVGGAVSGLGIESSSFRYGLVHETIEEMEILAGNGALVTCSPCVNRDLFFGFPNSYGTLGYALRLTVRLVPAKPFVHLTYTKFSESHDFFAHIEQLCDQGTPDFLDGVIFREGEMYVNQGVFSDEAPHVSDYTYMDIYYRSIPRKRNDWLTSKGYIWRWDTDWFWCSKHFGMETPAIRFLAKPALNSRTYQRLMRLSQRLLPASTATESVIQDVQIPIEHAPSFWDFLRAEVGITPVWVCPFRSSGQTYDLCGLEANRLYVNFGFWDVIPTTHESGHYNKRIEGKVMELGGTKGLYSASYYDKETFWRLHNQIRYEELKKAYDPDGLFPDLYAKCVERK